MTELQKANLARASRVDQAASSVSEFGTPHPTCRWQKASDGALVMVWSLTEADRSALRVVSGDLNSPRSSRVSNNGLAKRAQLINRTKAVAERAAIVLLLAGSAFLDLYELYDRAQRSSVRSSRGSSHIP
jgi:hypothetical protein